MTGVTSRDTRIEQAICYGRDDEWILAHVGGTQADIDRAVRRMDAANRGDNAAWRATLSDEARRGLRHARPLSTTTDDAHGTMNEPPRCANTSTALTTVPVVDTETRL